jgi:predicted nuclease of predicted toxin-antitoxin system
MARLYADENFSLPVVEELRLLGHDVLTAREAGRAGAGIPDPIVLDDATADSRAVLTHDRRDFIRLHSRQPQHAGIIVCTNDPDVLALAQRIDAAIRAAGPLDGKCLRVNLPA